jgi:periplasmic protein TonB
MANSATTLNPPDGAAQFHGWRVNLSVVLAVAVVLCVATVTLIYKPYVHGSSASSAVLKTLPVAQTQFNSGVRQQAMRAYAQGKLYAPAGDNAFEYYCAAARSAPQDFGLREAVLELVPGAMMALEGYISNAQFDEAQRLSALLEQADPSSRRLASFKSRLQARREIGRAQLAIASDVASPAGELINPEEPAARQIRPTEHGMLPATFLLARLPGQTSRAELATPKAPMTSAPVAPESLSRHGTLASPPEALVPEQSRTATLTAPRRQVPQPNVEPALPRSKTTDNIVEAKVLQSVTPVFPDHARRQKVQGWVELELNLDDAGRVLKAVVISAQPAKIFDLAARRAALRWRFSPKRINDTPTASTVRRRVNFNLNG